jgi:hypothetical protein
MWGFLLDIRWVDSLEQEVVESLELHLEELKVDMLDFSMVEKSVVMSVICLVAR